MSCDVGHRHEWDPAWLWLSYGLAAVAPIRPLAWELPYAAGAIPEKAKRRKPMTLTPKELKNQTGENRDQTCILMDTIQIHFCGATTGTSWFLLLIERLRLCPRLRHRIGKTCA